MAFGQLCVRAGRKVPRSETVSKRYAVFNSKDCNQSCQCSEKRQLGQDHSTRKTLDGHELALIILSGQDDHWNTIRPSEDDAIVEEPGTEVMEADHREWETGWGEDVRCGL